jgi:protein-S-isoprenylcysteine O-methyltransferase Ste14
VNVADVIAHSPLWSQPPLAILASVVVSLAFLLVAGAVVLDFASYYRQSRGVVNSDRSLVETGSMTVFFVAYYLVIRFRLLEVEVRGRPRSALVLIGLALVVLGVVFNVYGRVLLSSNWANQIKIYEGHTLVTGGPYSVVRHPLYASLIWIFVGGSLVYANPLSLALTLGVFLPMMYVRAGKEDALLAEAFGAEFEQYRQLTGLFLPRLRGR